LSALLHPFDVFWSRLLSEYADGRARLPLPRRNLGGDEKTGRCQRTTPRGQLATSERAAIRSSSWTSPALGYKAAPNTAPEPRRRRNYLGVPLGHLGGAVSIRLCKRTTRISCQSLVVVPACRARIAEVASDVLFGGPRTSNYLGIRLRYVGGRRCSGYSADQGDRAKMVPKVGCAKAQARVSGSVHLHCVGEPAFEHLAGRWAWAWVLRALLRCFLSFLVSRVSGWGLIASPTTCASRL
jgi:hypothetical protein